MLPNTWECMGGFAKRNRKQHCLMVNRGLRQSRCLLRSYRCVSGVEGTQGPRTRKQPFQRCLFIFEQGFFFLEFLFFFF